MRPSREIVLPRLRCPYCGAPRERHGGPRVYKTRDLPTGDTRRSCLCRTCGRTFHAIETDDFVHNVDTPVSGRG